MEAPAALRQARRHAALSQRALAARAGVSQSVVARIESGRVDPPLTTLNRLLALCGLRLTTALGLDGEREPAHSRNQARLAAQDVRRRLEAGIRAGQFVASRRVWHERVDGPLTQRALRAACREARETEERRLRREAARMVALENGVARAGAASAAQERAYRRAGALAHLTRWPLRDRLGDRAVAVAVAVSRVARVVLVGSTARAAWDPAASPAGRTARRTGNAGSSRRAGPARARARAPAAARPDVVEISVDPAAEGEAYRVLATAGLLAGTRVVPGFDAWWVGAAPIATDGRGAGVRVARPEQLPDAPWSAAATSVLLAHTVRDARGRQLPPVADFLAGVLD